MEQSRPYGPAVFDLGYEKPRPLAPGRRTAELVERAGPTGDVRIPLDEASLQSAIGLFEDQGVESVAICLLFSFMNPDHERRAEQALEAAHPEWWVSTSSDLLPQIREYYRLSTVVINAYVSPVLGRYVELLEQELDHRKVAPASRFTMQSNGGSSPFGSTSARAVGTILSGPAGGVTAASVLAAGAGISDIITFDMGGTSCDVALVQDGEPLITDRSKIAGRDLAVPMLDINTVSAGGGTVATVDQHGGLHVGPQSAGAVPGPACYQRGGELPTVTDADVVLGYLSPRTLLGGAMTLDPAMAAGALRTQVADPLGMDLVRAADGIARIVNVKMAEAIKAISTERGFDLRDFSLVPFGGAGPVHACQIAQDLGHSPDPGPAAPGATSALGLLMSDVKHDYLRSRLSDIADVSCDEVAELLEELGAQGARQLSDEGFSEEEIELPVLPRHAVRRTGLREPRTDRRPPTAAVGPEALPSQVRRHPPQCHGHAALDQPVEVVNYRVEAIGRVPVVELARLDDAQGSVEDARAGTRSAFFASLSDQLVPVPVYQRERLRAGHQFTGPALVDQYDSTTVICPGQAVTVDKLGNLVVESAR